MEGRDECQENILLPSIKSPAKESVSSAIIDTAPDCEGDAAKSVSNFLSYEHRNRIAQLTSQSNIGKKLPPLKLGSFPGYGNSPSSSLFYSPVRQQGKGLTPAGPSGKTPMGPEEVKMAQLVERIEKVFVEVLDENGDGNISFHEFSTAVEKLCPGLSDMDTHQLFDYIDQDNSNHLTFDEIADVISGTIIRHPETSDPQTLLRFAMEDLRVNRQRHGKIDHKTTFMLERLNTEIVNSTTYLREALKIHIAVMKGNLQSCLAKYNEEMEFLMNFVPRMGSNAQRTQLEEIQQGIAVENEMLDLVKDSLSKDVKFKETKITELEQKLQMQKLIHDNEKLLLEKQKALNCSCLLL